MPDFESYLASQERFIGTRANFVVSANGDLTDGDGLSRGLSNELDLSMLIKFRSLSDLIITDSKTAQVEGYKPSKHAEIQVWSASGNFGSLRSNAGLNLRQIEDAPTELNRLKSQALAILLETGPTLTRVLAGGLCIDELRLTVTGTPESSTAQAVSEATKKRLGLEYLVLRSNDSFGTTHFFCFGR